MPKTLVCHTTKSTILGPEFTAGQEYPVHEETPDEYRLKSDKQPFQDLRLLGFAKEPNRNGLSYKDYFTLKED